MKSKLRPDQYGNIDIVRKAQMREREKLDQIIFAITAGTLSLSVTILTNSNKNFVSTNILHFSWWMLLAGLASILFGYSFAILHFGQNEKAIREDKITTGDDLDGTIWQHLAEVCNWLSLLFLFVGIFLLAYFGTLNL